MVRVSGPRAALIARAITGIEPKLRHAQLATFRAADGNPIDRGIALFFVAPQSYTGEDVLELQGHGGPMVMRQLVARCFELGARAARPGEFTERAFLNERIDLAQAESVADLIDAASIEAARGAARSLTGEFSRRVADLVDALVRLRVHVEACIDFPEEEIDPEDLASQARSLDALMATLDGVLAEAKQGVVLREGLTVVLVGEPNVGKSSLLNRLARQEVAIVTPIAGTTRDYVRATIALEGVPIHLIDTAGLREARDEVERIGIERAWKAVGNAGAVVLVRQAGVPGGIGRDLEERLPRGVPRVHVLNKIDLLGREAGVASRDGVEEIGLSALTGAGVEALEAWLLKAAGWQPHGEGLFMARARHVDALRTARTHLAAAAIEQAFELKAEELRLAQRALGSITGEVSADALLGRIFASFCIGK